MTAIPTREHHLVAPSAVAAREDFASSLTGPRTRWWQFDPAYSNTPSWVQSVGLLPRSLWILMWFKILPGYPSYCGRLLDGHSEVSDTDIQDGAAIPGGGVSAFAIDHNVGADTHGSWSGVHYVCEAEQQDHANKSHFTIIPDSSLVFGRRYRLKINLNLGRRGSANPGAIRIWALDFDPSVPVVDLANISSVWGLQSVMHFFQGPYNIGAAGAAVQMAASRFGLSEPDAYADMTSRPITYTGQVAGYGPNDYTTALIPWDTVDFDSGVTPPPPTPGTLGKTSQGGTWRQMISGRKFANKITVPAGKILNIDDLQAYLRGSPTLTGVENLKPVIWDDAAGLPGNVVAIGTPISITGSAGGAIPTKRTPGAGNAGVATSMSFAFPAALAAGDLMEWIFFTRSGAVPTGTPSGWTSKVSAANGGTSKIWLFQKVATSGDVAAGTVTINVDLSALIGGRIYAFVGASDIEAIATPTTDSNTTLAPPLVTTLGPNRVAVILADVAHSAVALAAPTGNSGGTWTEPYAEYDSGVGEEIDMFTCDLAAAGTITGGSTTLSPASAWIALGFAVIPAGGTSPDAAGWYSLDMGDPDLGAGDYWIGFINSGTSGAAEIAYDTGAAGSEQYKADAGYGSIVLGQAFGTPDASNTQADSVYVDYTDITSTGATGEAWNSIPI